MLSESELAAAQKVRQTLEAKLARIAARTDLVPRAVARERAKAIVEAREGMSAIRQRSDERTAGEQAKAYRAAFGIRPDRSAEDRSYRDSLQARDIGWEEAAQLYAQAVARGDELAQTALAEYAWQNRSNPLDGHAWVGNVLQPYGESKPAYDAAIMTLLSEEDPDKMAQLRDKLATEVQQPTDLRGDLRALAADDSGSAASNSA